ncbi:MAG: hypothetical protein QM726_04785 [Chitinophagaceae bacterium]
MSFISPSAHKKFVEQCQNVINRLSVTDQANPKAAQLKADLEELQHLLDSYLLTISRIPELSKSYNDLQRRIRVNARKMQPAKNTYASRRQ